MKYRLTMAIALGALLASCGGSQTNKETAKGDDGDRTEKSLIEKSTIKIPDGIMTPEVLFSFGRISDVQLSPDRKTILYGVTYIGIKENKGNRELFTMNIDGSNKKQITKTADSEDNARWMKNGNKIAFLSPESGSSQLWEMNADGSGRTRLSDIEGGIDGFQFSPDETKILYYKNVKDSSKIHTKDLYPDLPKANARIMGDLMYKHWDQWMGEIPHPFVADFDGSKLSNITDILAGEAYECPMLPYPDMGQLAWSPDSKTIAYTCRKKVGKAYALSTNSDIYLYDVASKKTVKNLTEGMMGYDMNPVFSHDGKSIAWQSMERDGYESDQIRLFVMDLASGNKTYLTKTFDYNTDFVRWGDDDKSIYFVACVNATTQLWNVNIANNKITQLTQGDHDYESFEIAGNKLIATMHSISQPNELYAIDNDAEPISKSPAFDIDQYKLKNPSQTFGKVTELSFENKDILAQLKMGKVEERWIKTTDNKQMLTWVIYPPNFDPNKKYPTLLYCEGGPQSTVSQFWSYRWNFQMMAADGYIIVAPCRRGMPGFGQAWNEQISGDYGGQNMKDYLSAIDELCKEPYVDKTKLGCTGASYGGFSVYWLAGHHNKRFKAFLSHAGIFNLEAQYLETEEMWFANWDLGGAYWDKNNKIAQRSYANSPHLFVDKWDTPIMITCGQKDYRIVYTQNMMAFDAAQLRGIPSRLIVFPDEDHWISKPQDGILWQREFKNWFDKWLK